MPIKFLKSKKAPADSASKVDVSSIVRGVIDDVRANGDAAVRKFSEKFDKWSPASFKLSKDEIEASIAACSPQTIKDIEQVQRNVRAFAEAQKDSLKDFEFEIQPVSIKNNDDEATMLTNLRVSSLVRKIFLSTPWERKLILRLWKNE
jgi:histidinol dehydrogenase